MSFSAAAPPKLAGDYTRFVIKRQPSVPASAGKTVCVPFTDDWGPDGQFVNFASFGEYIAIAGQPIDPATPSDGYVGVYQAFKGGAGSVLGYRLTGSGAAKANISLQSSSSSVLTLTAKYKGVKGNHIKVEVVANAADSANKRDVHIYVDTVQVESYEGYGTADNARLATDINGESGWVDASGAASGKLDLLSATALSGGDSGNTLVSGDWTSFMTAASGQRFGYVAPANVTDTSIQAAFVAWAAALNAAERSKRLFFVEGGPSGDSYSTAKTRTDAANNENVVNWGIGTFRDPDLNLVLSTAQLAPRLAGVMASRGGTASLSFARLEDLELVTGPSDTDTIAAVNNGVVVAGIGNNGTVRFERGVTTYTSDTAEKPKEVYGNIKFVTTMQNFERDGQDANESGDVIGRVPVNAASREYLVGRETQRLQEYIARGEVAAKDVNGNPARVVIASDPPASDLDDFIAVDWIGAFSRSLEQIRRTVYYS